jgi:hypothetical protein
MVGYEVREGGESRGEARGRQGERGWFGEMVKLVSAVFAGWDASCDQEKALLSHRLCALPDSSCGRGFSVIQNARLNCLLSPLTISIRLTLSQDLEGHVPASRVSDAEKFHPRSSSNRQHGQQRVSSNSAERGMSMPFVMSKTEKAGLNMCASSKNGMPLPLVIGLS